MIISTPLCLVHLTPPPVTPLVTTPGTTQQPGDKPSDYRSAYLMKGLVGSLVRDLVRVRALTQVGILAVLPRCGSVSRGNRGSELP